MIVFPAFTPVTNPVLVTVPFAGVPETQALLAAAVPLPVSCILALGHRVFTPEIVGLGFTFTVCCAVVAHCPTDGVKV